MRGWGIGGAQAQLDTRALEMAIEASAEVKASNEARLNHERLCVEAWRQNAETLKDLGRGLGSIRRILQIGLGIGMAIGAMNTPLGQRVAQILTGSAPVQTTTITTVSPSASAKAAPSP